MKHYYKNKRKNRIMLSFTKHYTYFQMSRRDVRPNSVKMPLSGLTKKLNDWFSHSQPVGEVKNTNFLLIGQWFSYKLTPSDF